jgi:hypothetical protein
LNLSWRRREAENGHMPFNATPIRAALVAVAAAVACAVPAAATTSTAAPTVDPHQVYVLGDSYTFDMQGTRYSAGRTLEQAFAAKGWTAVVSGRGGRAIGGTPTPNGLSQVAADRAKIAASSTVVVELGTNITPDGKYFASRAATLLEQIHAAQPKARVWWVVPANRVTSAGYQSALSDNRTTILNLPGVAKIRWDRAVQAAWFSAADGFKHPRVDGPDVDGRADGYDKLETLIVGAVTG